jgi:hypothetical protein
MMDTQLHPSDLADTEEADALGQQELDQYVELDLHAKLLTMPDKAVFPTREARVYIRVSPATWERLRKLRLLPPAIRLTERMLGYRKADLDKYLADRTEKQLETIAA